MWYARSAECLQTPLIGWLRIVANTVFASGVLSLGWFVLRLKTGWSLADEPDTAMAAPATVMPEGT